MYFFFILSSLMNQSIEVARVLGVVVVGVVVVVLMLH
jgi:hypothetical protein